ncbi:hypothetical protein U2I53_03120 [Lysinibacillus capsici]
MADKEEKVEDRTFKVTDKINVADNLFKVADKKEKVEDRTFKVTDKI